MSLFFGKSQVDEAMEKKEVSADEFAADTAQEDNSEHYDGSGMKDVFKNYEDARSGGLYVPIHFVETRKYLQQVRDQKRRIELLEKRIGYRRDAGLYTESQENELDLAKEQLKKIIAEVADEISKVGDVNQEVVLTKRYIDIMSWDEVAMSADLKMYTVQRCHGKALPKMEEILLTDGLIALEEADGEDEYSS